MSTLIDDAEIRFDFVMKTKLLAKVTLCFQGVFEIRYCRLTMRPDSTLWFQPPALAEYGYVKCFIILDPEMRNKLEQRVINQFIQEYKEKVNEGIYSPSLLVKIKNAGGESLSEEEIKNLNKHIK